MLLVIALFLSGVMPAQAKEPFSCSIKAKYVSASGTPEGYFSIENKDSKACLEDAERIALWNHNQQSTSMTAENIDPSSEKLVKITATIEVGN